MIVPEGFAAVTPYLFVDDADAYARFLGVAFGGRELGRSTDPDGRIANCQVRIATATVMLSEASDEFPPSRAAFYLYVDDADAAMARAVAAGAETIMDLADMPYGDRQGGVRDPAGIIWWLSRRVSDEPYF